MAAGRPKSGSPPKSPTLAKSAGKTKSRIGSPKVN